MYSVDTLRKVMIRIPGRTERGGAVFQLRMFWIAVEQELQEGKLQLLARSSVLPRKLGPSWGRPSLDPATSTTSSSAHLTLTHTTAIASELAFIYLALTLHDEEVTVTEDKINALIKAAGVNVEHFWLSLFAKALANVNVRSLIGNVGVGGPATAADGAPARGPTPTTADPPKKEESQESDDMGFGFLTKPLHNILNKS
ncbi:60S acidic ribosomal protein P1-like [Pteronotus mesoamericanus]|uniref:60S acidic ribosomal protein P1-like n=1 Tax=Pteronotus mesoamericanus TaxID=1884717 RepID=UPI0023EC41F3|nr:60S acidic ribosomal protein P1-like [Pteronotus parnellii mesoamericanus]